MYVILITDLPRVWGGDQGTMHSAGHFFWLRRRQRKRWTLPRTRYLGIYLTSLGEAISSTTHRNLLPVSQGGALSCWCWASLTKLFHMGLRYAFCLNFPLLVREDKTPPPPWPHPLLAPFPVARIIQCSLCTRIIITYLILTRVL